MDLPPQFNVAPGQTIYAVRAIALRETHARDAQPRQFAKEVAPLKWGFIPFWVKKRPTTEVINARAETIMQKASFKAAFKQRRCLIPADGFYEWKKIRSGNKQPFFVRMADAKPFALAGIWDAWVDQNGKRIESCAIITTPSNELLKPIHNRMPAIIEPQLFDTWLNPSPTSVEEALALLRPFDAKKMEAYPVSDLINNAKNESAQCIQPKKERYKQQKLQF